jgi:hypothetical protein
MTGVILFFTLLANVIPLGGLIIGLVMPFLTAGFYKVCSLVEQGEETSPSQIFSLLSEFAQFRVLMHLGLIAILISIPFAASLETIQVNIEQGIPPSFGDLALITFLMGLNFMLLSFAVPAAWVAPQTSVIDLLTQSFKACWLNVIPLTLYGVLMLGIAAISLPLIIVGWLIAIALGYTTFYQAFMDIYQPVADATSGAAEQSDSNKEQSNEDEQNSAERAEQSQSEKYSQHNVEQDDNVQQEDDSRTDNGPR